MATSLMFSDSGEVPGKTRAEQEATLKYWNSFNLDQYYSDIEAFTFLTEFVDFTKEEGEAFLQQCRKTSNDLTASPALAALVDRIDAACDRIRGKTSKDTKLFIKLSSRSAKDAVDKRPAFLTPHLKMRLQERPGPKDPAGVPTDKNEVIISIRKAFLDSMAVTCAAEALEQFSYSARIISDLKRVRRYYPLDFNTMLDIYTVFQKAIDYNQWDLHIVVREFSGIPIEGELRGIVKNGHLNALTQYYSECFFSSLLARKDEIAKSVKKFHKQVKKHIKHESYIFDVVVFDDLTVKIVELNPYGENTGAGLFSWKADLKVIEEGPFEFRVRTEPLGEEHLTAVIAPWKHLVDDAVAPPASLTHPTQSTADSQKCIVS